MLLAHAGIGEADAEVIVDGILGLAADGPLPRLPLDMRAGAVGGDSPVFI